MKYFFWTLIFILGIFWIHFDMAVIIVALGLIFIAPLILIAIGYFSFEFAKGWKRNDEVRKGKALNGFMIVSLVIISPIISAWGSEEYCKFKSVRALTEINNFNSNNGRLPKDQNELSIKKGLFNLKYERKSTKDFKLSYKSRGTVSTVYTSDNDSWETYGWND